MADIEIIIINGLGGSGKSSFVQSCINYCNFLGNVACVELSMVDYIKRIARIIGWNGTKSEKDRIFLSDLKLAMEHWDDIPLKKLEESVISFINKNKKKTCIIFINSRELDDIEKITEWANNNGYLSRILEITRPNIVSNEVPMLVTQIDALKPDDIIINNGPYDTLTHKAENYIETLLNTWEHQENHINM